MRPARPHNIFGNAYLNSCRIQKKAGQHTQSGKEPRCDANQAVPEPA